MRALVLALSLVVLATAGPVVAHQPEEQPPSEEQPRSTRDGDRMAGGRCKSDAEKKETAEEFCEGQLDCASAGKTVSCSGRTNRWVCVCA